MNTQKISDNWRKMIKLEGPNEMKIEKLKMNMKEAYI